MQNHLICNDKINKLKLEVSCLKNKLEQEECEKHALMRELCESERFVSVLKDEINNQTDCIKCIYNNNIIPQRCQSCKRGAKDRFSGGESMRTYLKDAREKRGLSVIKTAEVLGVTRGYYYMIEAGERQQDMPLETAVKLSKLFKVSLSEFIKKERAWKNENAN